MFQLVNHISTVLIYVWLLYLISFNSLRDSKVLTRSYIKCKHLLEKFLMSYFNYIKSQKIDTYKSILYHNIFWERCYYSIIPFAQFSYKAIFDILQNRDQFPIHLFYFSLEAFLQVHNSHWWSICCVVLKAINSLICTIWVPFW